MAGRIVQGFWSEASSIRFRIPLGIPSIRIFLA